MKRLFDGRESDHGGEIDRATTAGSDVELKKKMKQVTELEEEKKLPMKRQLDAGENYCDGDLKKKMKMKEVENETDAVLLDENLLYEVLKHVDGRTLANAACVNKQWNQTALDERLWELICTKHNGRNQQQQLRAVVLALGGFRRLYSLYLWPLSKPSPSPSPSKSLPSSSAWPCLPPPLPRTTTQPSKHAATNSRWGKDEVNLSLSLLSIRYYEKMNFKAYNKSA